MNGKSSFTAMARELLGPRGFTQDHDVMGSWLTDWRGRYTGKALALASPASTQQVADLLKLCSRFSVPVVPQGGNSSMSGGATPDESGQALLVSLRRMNRILSIDRDSGQAVCEAGVVLQTLHEAADRHGLRFPLTLGGKGSATIGGLISTNAGGTQVLRHGTMRAQVLGLEVVLASGEILRGLTTLKKDNRGFDLKQLMIGSEGTLGIVTGANLRLVPRIDERIVIWAGLESIQQARRLLVHCQKHAGAALEGFEVVPHHSLSAVLEHLPSARAPLPQAYPWNALLEFVAERGQGPEVSARVEDTLGQALEKGLVEDAVKASSEQQAEAFWHLRDSISAAERAKGPALQHDISVPVERMADFVEQASLEVEQAFPGTRAVAFGHLGDGNVHFHVRAPHEAEQAEWHATDGKAITRFIHDLVTAWDGSISAEHGIGQMKRDELERLGDPVALSVMRSVKRALDPQNLLNPGKLVTLAKDGTKP